MALTESTMLKLGSKLPAFSLPDVSSGKPVSNESYADKPLLVAFICNHCPYVVHISEAFARVAQDYADAGVGVVAISSNDVGEYPADSPEKMKVEAEVNGYSFPYLFDETQSVAHAFTAACTPDFFLFNSNHELVYRGRFDETRPDRIRSGVYESNNKASGAELSAAVHAMVKNEAIAEQQLPSLGCNIKWKSGNEPSY